MGTRTSSIRVRALLLLGVAIVCGCTPRAGLIHEVFREQRQLEVRDPALILPIPPPPAPPPETVSNPTPEGEALELSLDEAIRIALGNSEVVRVLSGVSARSSGLTIYDPAISNTQIDAARAVFDPTLTAGEAFNRVEQPNPIVDPNAPLGATLFGSSTDRRDFSVGVSKRTITGGTANLTFTNNHSDQEPSFSPLNPSDRSALTLSYTQPFFQGAGIEANVAPIVIARINTERSYFQFKDSVQELVRGVIDAYWAVVFAHVDVWARQQQVAQGRFLYERTEARVPELATAGEAAQARVSYLSFQNALIAAEANLLEREAALRNIMGLPPTEPVRLVVTTPPTDSRLQPKWEELVRLAIERRPDLIELKLILEADQESLLLAQNQAQPRVDTTVLYRWNGLEGRTPTGRFLSSDHGEFTDWTVGVNFSVPLGLRQGRANLRSAQLRVARDMANIDQGLHQVIHDLSGVVRALDQNYEQYELLREIREAARINVRQQLAEVESDRAILLNLLQAISDWGNAISAEAQALTQYNGTLARLERQTGTILESHGIRLFEERYQSIGPLGICGDYPEYPLALIPSPNEPGYADSDEPAQNFFNLESIPELSDPQPREELPPPKLAPVDPGK